VADSFPQLLGGRYAPITDSIAFVEAPMDVVLEALLAWRRIRPRRVSLFGPSPPREGSGTLEDALRRIHHLGTSPSLELLVGMRNGWTARFDGGLNGGDHFSFVSVLSERLARRAIYVQLVEDRPRSGDRPARFGAVALHVFLPTDGDPDARVLAATNDGGRWSWDAFGPVQPYEHGETYDATDVRDRFPPELLLEYCDRIGVGAFREEDYGPRHVLIDTGYGRSNITLGEARRRLGLDPTGAGIDG
jgi:hypothetical protein